MGSVVSMAGLTTPMSELSCELSCACQQRVRACDLPPIAAHVGTIHLSSCVHLIVVSTLWLAK